MWLSSTSNYVGIYLFVICILVGYIYVEYFKTTLVYQKSTVDGKDYLVRNLPDKQEAANLLANIKETLLTLITKLRSAYPKDKRIQLLQDRFQPEFIRESEPNSQLSSFTIDKSRITFCLRSRDEYQKLVSLNVLVFVALHELSHIMTISVNHSAEFWDNFRFILAHAIYWKIYKPQNFLNNPEKYCGTFITNSPLKLEDIPKYVQFDTNVSEENEAMIRTVVS